MTDEIPVWGDAAPSPTEPVEPVDPPEPTEAANAPEPTDPPEAAVAAGDELEWPDTAGWGDPVEVLMPPTPEGFRSGYVALIGRPNVGRSSLINALLGERLAPTSPVPQTTRRRLLGIMTEDDFQIVFVDTPGLHQAKLRLSQMMLQDARASLVDADVVLVVVDSAREPGEEDRLAQSYAAAAGAPQLLVLNKIDLVTGGNALPDYRAAHRAECPDLPAVDVSALTGDGLDTLMAALLERLPEGPPFFPADQVSDVMERDVAAELIREAALRRLSEELPHAIAVRVDDWKDRPGGLVYIHAHLYVERDSQKGMVIGRGGRMLRSIGALAREGIEHWLGQRVYLELEVRVLKGWRKNPRMLRYLGFQPPSRD